MIVIEAIVPLDVESSEEMMEGQSSFIILGADISVAVDEALVRYQKELSSAITSTSSEIHPLEQVSAIKWFQRHDYHESTIPLAQERYIRRRHGVHGSWKSPDRSRGVVVGVSGSKVCPTCQGLHALNTRQESAGSR